MNKQIIYFAKLRPEVIVPTKREEDGAFDIYACFEEDFIVVMPHETKMIPTGLASAFLQDYVAILKERGSTGSKGIGQRAGVVDSGYRGEWFVPITNHNKVPLIIIKEGKKVALSAFEDAIIYPYEKAISQCIMVEVPRLSVKEITYEALLEFESQRGTGMLGSSGK